MECLATYICMWPHSWPHMLKQGAVPMAEYNERVRGRGRWGGRDREREGEGWRERGREREGERGEGEGERT